MATVPKAAVAPVPANVSSSRMGPPTRVASLQGGVDELQSNAGVPFDGATFGFREEDRPSFNRGGRGGYHHQSHSGLVNAPTQAFAAMLESAETVTAGSGGAGDVSSPRFAGLVAKAIAIYETNASVLSGTNNVLGTSVSLVL